MLAVSMHISMVAQWCLDLAFDTCVVLAQWGFSLGGVLNIDIYVSMVAQHQCSCDLSVDVASVLLRSSHSAV